MGIDKNPTGELALLRYALSGLIDASAALGRDAELRPQWEETLCHLAPCASHVGLAIQAGSWDANCWMGVLSWLRLPAQIYRRRARAGRCFSTRRGSRCRRRRRSRLLRRRPSSRRCLSGPAGRPCPRSTDARCPTPRSRHAPATASPTPGEPTRPISRPACTSALGTRVVSS